MAKVFAYAMGDRTITLTEVDKDAAKSLVKKMSDQRYDWLPEQREQFKMFVDIVVN